MTPQSLRIITILGIALIAGAIVFAMAKSSQISSYEECVDAGYPVQESYPSVCSAPGNKTFVNPEHQFPPNRL